MNRGALAPTFRRWVFDGDSNIYGNAAPASAMPVFLHEFANLQPCLFSNIAHNGWVWQDMVNAFDSEALPLAPSSTGVPSTLFFLIGRNNIQRGDGDTLVDGLDGFIDTALGRGYFVGGTTPWGSPDWDATQNNQLDDYAEFLLGDPRLACVLSGQEMFPNPNTAPYFITDDNHLNPTGQEYFAQQVHALLLSSGHYL